jgi:hypothetical protein
MAIGANAMVFSVLNALILYPLHVPQAESLYGIQHGNEASSYQSYPDYLDLRDRNRSFDLAMLLLGLLATWIPAQRALSIDPRRNPASEWIDPLSTNGYREVAEMC